MEVRVVNVPSCVIEHRTGHGMNTERKACCSNTCCCDGSKDSRRPSDFGGRFKTPRYEPRILDPKKMNSFSFCLMDSLNASSAKKNQQRLLFSNLVKTHVTQQFIVMAALTDGSSKPPVNAQFVEKISKELED